MSVAISSADFKLTLLTVVLSEEAKSASVAFTVGFMTTRHKIQWENNLQSHLKGQKNLSKVSLIFIYIACEHLYVLDFSCLSNAFACRIHSPRLILKVLLLISSHISNATMISSLTSHLYHFLFLYLSIYLSLNLLYLLLTLLLLSSFSLYFHKLLVSINLCFQNCTYQHRADHRLSPIFTPVVT